MCDGSSHTHSEFFLRDGDTYVIYGDSITDNSVHARTIENYLLTRFPTWHVTFYNYGWGGDVARNLFRLRRDVLPIKPAAFTDNLGMNDAGCRPPDAGLLETYIQAYRQMIPLLRETNPHIRIALLSAIAYENKGMTDLADGAYSQSLRQFARAKRRLAREFGVEYVDLFTEYAMKIGLGKNVYPDFFLSPDGVHPDPVGQTIMAQIILKGLHAPSQMAGLELDVSGRTIKAARTEWCKVKDLAISERGEISFGRLTEALPCPVEPTDERARRFLDVVGFSDEINRDLLTVRGLAGAAYEIRMDGVLLGTFRGQDLAMGVNLSEPMKGPLWDRAMAVAQVTQERQAAHYAMWRSVLLKNGDSVTGQYDRSDQTQLKLLEVQANLAIRRQRELNAPPWTRITLTPCEEPALAVPEGITYTNLGRQFAPPHMEPLDWTKETVQTVDLHGVVNRAFADEVEGDGQGGWSDQGPNNDLASFPVGRQVLNGVPFDVIDPAINNNRSMIVLSHRPGLKVPDRIRIPLNVRASALAFLHTGAWMNPESWVDLVFHYAGGVRLRLGFLAGRHLTDWSQTVPLLPAAVRAWTGKNPSFPIAVRYAPIINPHPEATIEAVEMTIPENYECVYGLIAITAKK